MRKRKKPPLKRLRNNPNELCIDTEGIQYVINWAEFPINGFVFIKCVATDEVSKRIRGSAAHRGIGVALRVGIRNGYWGVGLWRTK